MGHPLFPAGTFTLILMTAVVAGCADSGEGGGVGGDESALSREEALALFERAFGDDADPPEGVTRAGIHGEVAALDPGEEADGEFDLLLDTEGALAMISMQGELFQNDSSTPLIASAESIVFGSVWKTFFIGAPDGLLGVYNESMEPVESFSDLAEQGDVGTSPAPDEEGGLSDPFKILSAMGNLPDGATIVYEVIEVDGKEALKLTATHEGPGLVALEAVAWIESELPVSIEATYEDEDADDPVARHGTFSLVFTYGEDAQHELEDGLVRLETMTILNTTGAPPGFGFTPPSDEPGRKEYVVQPSGAPGFVPLDEVTAIVWGADAATGGMGEPELELPLEELTAEGEGVSLTFTDEDGDGHVSTGDTLLLVVDSGDTSNFTVGLRDEVSGLTVLPGFGLWAALAALGVALVLLRRR